MPEPTPGLNPNRHARSVRIWTGAAGAALLALAIIAVGLPLLTWLAHALNATGSTQPPPIRTLARLLESLLVAGLIGAISCAIALPTTPVVRAMHARFVPLLLVPLLMPQYLAYAGWGLLRAPGTPIGDALERAAMEGHQWAPVFAGKTLAVLGLAIWAWPIAALLIGVGARRINQDAIDAMRIESSAPRRAAAHLVAMLRGPIAGAWLLIAVLMLGSAVPLHVAQFDTFANAIWLALSLEAPDQQWRVTLAAWPMLLIAIVAGWTVASRILRVPDAGDAPAGTTPTRSRTARAYTIALWLVAVAAPLVLFAINIRTASAFGTFFRTSGRALGDSLLSSFASAGGAAAVAALVWFAVGATARTPRTAILGIRLLTIGAFIPGVLIGTMLIDTYGRIDAVAETRLVRVIADLARFGVVPVLAGVAAAAAESDAQRAARTLDGADTPGGWLRPNLPVGLALIAAAAIAVALLALHEIEAAVMVQPPGLGTLSQRILGYLHYARTEAMSVAGVVLIGGGTLVATAAALIGGRTARTQPPTNR